MKKAMVLFSGGVDSTTCLALAVANYGAENVIALSIHYGQKHDKEILAARTIINYYHVQSEELDLSQIFAGSNCSLLRHSTDAIPHESYEEQREETRCASFFSLSRQSSRSYKYDFDSLFA